MTLARLLEQAEQPRPSGEASPLWHQARAACDGSRADMWDWLEERYLNSARLLIDMADDIGPCECSDGYTIEVEIYGSSPFKPLRQVPGAEPAPLPPCRRCRLLARFAELDKQAIG